MKANFDHEKLDVYFDDNGISWNRTIWQMLGESSFVSYGDIIPGVF